jgi:hypothetical protein
VGDVVSVASKAGSSIDWFLRRESEPSPGNDIGPYGAGTVTGVTGAIRRYPRFGIVSTRLGRSASSLSVWRSSAIERVSAESLSASVPQNAFEKPVLGHDLARVLGEELRAGP